jgi:DNA mismatch endonuclease (patch repair protein)
MDASKVKADRELRRERSMADIFSKAERSRLMSGIRGKGNRSTEEAARLLLRLHRIKGWRRHQKRILGTPDFYFPNEKVAVFIDGCFWHGCAKCGKASKSRLDFWLAKIERNQRRDRRYTRTLRSQGVRVLRVWEHDVKAGRWVARLMRMLSGSILGGRSSSTTGSGAPR